jgi:hypothetical protein
VGVRSSHIVSEVADTAGTCAIGGDHMFWRKARGGSSRSQDSEQIIVRWEGDFNKQNFLYNT